MYITNEINSVFVENATKNSQYSFNVQPPMYIPVLYLIAVYFFFILL